MQVCKFLFRVLLCKMLLLFDKNLVRIDPEHLADLMAQLIDYFLFVYDIDAQLEGLFSQQLLILR